MKRRSVRAGFTAPEGFDDILFGTTGLILVLLTWALTQIGIPEVSKETLDAMAAELAAAQQARSRAEDTAARERGARAEAERQFASERRRREQSERAQAQAEAAQRRAEDARERAEEAEARAKREKNELEPKPCDVLIAIDTTASQAPAIDALQRAARSLSEIGARLSPRFRIGVVAYNGEGLVTFPLTEIGATSGGNPSTGMQQLQTFLDGLGTVSGTADVEGALKEALAKLDSVARSGTRQLLVLCGDVGPWESGELEVIESFDRESARRSVGFVRSFAERSDQNRVLALFSGQNSNAANKDETVVFFRDVARAAGDRGTYSDDVSQLSATLVEALFGQ